MIVAASPLLDRLMRQPRYADDDVLPIELPTMSRDFLPILSHDLGFTRGAEIGVWRGSFSVKFCDANPNLHMLCVDPWVSYPAWVDTKNATADPEAFMAEAYAIARRRLQKRSCTILKRFSADAARTVPDASLDFVYIDANHSFEAVSKDLTLWSPKVRSGGWIGGHDFRTFTNKPFVQVIPAVEAFTKAQAIDPWFVLAADPTPSFLWVVP